MLKSKENPSGIYLLPNLLTTASLFAAFYSIVSSLKGLYEPAVIAIFVGMVADGLDGRIARLTNTQSAFGAEYDSLSDMVTFGVAPSLLVYSWGLHQLGKFGWLVAFIYTATVALRLARFNVQIQTVDKKYFHGLACPAGAAIVSAFVWFCVQYNWQYPHISLLTAILTVFISFLMISNFRYYSFKEIDFKGKVPFLYGFIIIVLFVAIAAAPSPVLFFGFLLYAFSGIVHRIILVTHRRRARKNREEKI